jgi:hypothetical protein
MGIPMKLKGPFMTNVYGISEFEERIHNVFPFQLWTRFSIDSAAYGNELSRSEIVIYCRSIKPFLPQPFAIYEKTFG